MIKFKYMHKLMKTYHVVETPAPHLNTDLFQSGSMPNIRNKFVPSFRHFLTLGAAIDTDANFNPNTYDVGANL